MGGWALSFAPHWEPRQDILSHRPPWVLSLAPHWEPRQDVLSQRPLHHWTLLPAPRIHHPLPRHVFPTLLPCHLQISLPWQPLHFWLFPCLDTRNVGFLVLASAGLPGCGQHKKAHITCVKTWKQPE